MDEVTFILDSCIGGYHVYKDFWNATPGITLTCIREQGNRDDMFTLQCKVMAILLGIYLGKFRVFVCFLYVEMEY